MCVSSNIEKPRHLHVQEFRTTRAQPTIFKTCPKGSRQNSVRRFSGGQANFCAHTILSARMWSGGRPVRVSVVYECAPYVLSIYQATHKVELWNAVVNYIAPVTVSTSSTEINVNSRDTWYSLVYATKMRHQDNRIDNLACHSRM